MHVLFLVMRCRPDGDYEIILKGLRVFSHLLKAFFKATCNMEVSASDLFPHVRMYIQYMYMYVCKFVCCLLS